MLRLPSTASRSSTSGAASPTRRRARPWRARHARERVLDDQGRHRGVRASARRARRARPRRAGRALLARVRGRTGRSASRCAGCSRTAPGSPAIESALHARRALSTGTPMVAARSPRRRRSGSRARSTATTRSRTAGWSASSCAASRARSLGRFFARGGRRAARRRVLDRPAGSRGDARSSTIIPPEPDPRRDRRRCSTAVIAPDTIAGRVLTTAREPLPLRRDVEHARAARGRAAVVERHRRRARALARLYASLRRRRVDGVRLLRADDASTRARAEQSYGKDAVLVAVDALRARLHAAARRCAPSARPSRLRPPRRRRLARVRGSRRTASASAT